MTPEEWEDYSDVNINKAEQERMSSKQLRSITDGILQQAANDMNKQKAETDLCFDKRIRETKETKAKLEEHLARVSMRMRVILNFQKDRSCVWLLLKKMRKIRGNVYKLPAWKKNKSKFMNKSTPNPSLYNQY